eukprot:1924126-Amphidinium_carterae.1
MSASSLKAVNNPNRRDQTPALMYCCLVQFIVLRRAIPEHYCDENLSFQEMHQGDEMICERLQHCALLSGYVFNHFAPAVS